MKILLLANPNAAGGRARRQLPALCNFLSRRLSQFDYQPASSAKELREAARRAAGAGYDRVLVAGGDGTFHAAINGLRGSAAAFGAIPLGNGNDLCRSLGLPRDPMAAADFLLRAPVSEMDLVRVGEEAYAGVAGAGFDAEANRRANAWPVWPRGHLRYWLAGFLTKLTYQPQMVEFATESESFREEVLWVAFANTPYYGGGLRIAPAARYDDGLLDICVIGPRTFAELLELYPALYDGKHLTAPGVRTFRAAEVEFRAPAGFALHGDGEPMTEAPFRLQVERRALRVLCCKAGETL